MNTDTRLDESVLILLDEVYEPPCESLHHDAGDAGEIMHRGPARYWQQGPCRHVTGFRCESSVLSAMTTGTRIVCEQCKQVIAKSDLTFRRLES